MNDKTLQTVTCLAASCLLLGCSDGPDSKTGDPTNNPNTDAGQADGADSNSTSNNSTPPGRTILVALGDFGRSTISCDGGQTWVADSDLSDVEDLQDDLFCGVDASGLQCEDACTTRAGDECVPRDRCACEEAPFLFAAGSYAGGWIFKRATGRDVVQRSRDGVAWETVVNEPRDAVSAVFEAGERLVRIGMQPTLEMFAVTSDDEGATWSEPVSFEAETPLYPRKAFQFDYEGSSVGIVFGAQEGAIRTADGVTFDLVDLPAGCGDPPYVLAAAGRVVAIGRSGVCVSDDGGRTFVEGAFNVEPSGGLQMYSDFSGSNGGITTDGTRHYMSVRSTRWQGPTILATEDGENWEDLGNAGNYPDVIPIAYDTAGNRLLGWVSMYESQTVYATPTDTRQWSDSRATFAPSHAMRQVLVVGVSDDFTCPE